MSTSWPSVAEAAVSTSFAALAGAARCAHPWVVVDTAAGRVAGIRRRRTSSFRGIPYAAPPVGDRRFRAPAPVVPWTGVRDATAPGRQAPQQSPARRYPFGPARSGESEDCLTLEVTTPSADDARRPVLVWLHPGAWVDGAASWVLWDGAALAAAGDVVVVAVDHRLGCLGWMPLDHLGGGGESSTNLGLLDQIAALEWVRDNIAGFGGDPDRVTLVGSSAGGSSVAALMAAPAARGLFHRAAIQSGPVAHVVPPERASAIADRVLAAAGVTSVAQLREVDLARLTDAQARVVFALALEHTLHPSLVGHFAFGPVVDGGVLPEAPLDAVGSGSAVDVPLLIGTNRDEWAVFSTMARSSVTDDELATWVTSLVGEGGPGALDAVRRVVGPEPLAVRDAVLTDLLFTLPSRRFADAHRRRGAGRTFSYLFDRSALPGVGATHGVEQPYVFGRVRPWHLTTTTPLIGLAPPRRLVVAMRDAWVAFARSGDPDHPAMPDWAPYDDARTMAVFDDPVRVAPDPLSDRLAAWSGVL